MTKFLKNRGSVCFDWQIEGSVHHGGENVVLGDWINLSHCNSSQKAENGQEVGQGCRT